MVCKWCARTVAEGTMHIPAGACESCSVVQIPAAEEVRMKYKVTVVYKVEETDGMERVMLASESSVIADTELKLFAVLGALNFALSTKGAVSK